MLKAVSVIRKAAVKSEHVIASISLGYQLRQHPPSSFQTLDHRLLDIGTEAQKALHAGDALKLEDGSLVLVKAEEESLLRITSDHPVRLMRLAYQLGSRHVPVECHASELFVPHDLALAEFVRGQGCKTEELLRLFEPEMVAEHHHHHHGDHSHEHSHDDHAHHGCCGHHH
jgi:urease accessory protein